LQIPIDRVMPLATAVRARAPIFLATAAEVREQFPMFEKVATVHDGGLRAVPLIVEGRVLGGLQLCFGEGRHPRDLDSDFFQTIADLTAHALERAALFDDLKKNERLFRSLAETAPMQVWVEGPDHRLAYVNPRGLEYLGMSLEELRRSEASSLREALWQPEDQQASGPTATEAKRNGRMIDVTVRVRRADGVYRRNIVRAAPLRDASGAVEGWVGTTTDVEQLLQTEAALREKEAHLRYLFESAIIGIGTFNREGTVTSANQAWLSMLGYTAEDIAAGVVRSDRMTPPEFREITAQAAESLRRDGYCAPYEKETVRKDGSRVPILIGATLVDADHGVFFIIDLSDRKRIEREHAAHLDQDQKFRERLLGIVGHDLRNPLAAIESWAQILKLSPALAGDELAAISRIDRTIARMRRMISQLLDFTAARQAGGLPLRRKRVNLGAICREAVEELSSAHPGRLVLQATGELTGEWDPDRMGQLVSNLAANALQHGDGGAVIITVSEEDDGVRLEVHNGGPAIPEAELMHLFDPYRRAQVASYSRPAGLGLGLYIVQQIVKAHDGAISVRSSAEAGTTFSARLPR
jgi:PAS domain S-box-containing protein